MYKLFIWVKCDGGITSQVVEFSSSRLADIAFENIRGSVSINATKLY